MKIARFVSGSGQTLWGSLRDDGRALPIEGDLLGKHRLTAESVEVSRLLAPIIPPNIIAIGRNYPEHAKEMKASETLAEPIVFLKATSSVIGPGDDIVLPNQAADEVDFEGELAVVIGKSARCVSDAEALSFVLGYACANDVTARDCQKRRDKQWARGKSFDTFCPLGPVIATPESFDPSRARVRSFVNGREMQNGPTSDMLFGVPHLISYLSHQFTILPGTVILTGTPNGVGSARNPPVFLRAGDEVRIEIDGIGVLSNRVR
jgi:2-keto-4-pentenoate hydratase/2-oxohepta-3-ene-1,7-dioic acid hydratase in catechol pathway